MTITLLVFGVGVIIGLLAAFVIFVFGGAVGYVRAMEDICERIRRGDE
jgi:hypothetical protein